jgi:hypothetical protein
VARDPVVHFIVLGFVMFGACQALPPDADGAGPHRRQGERSFLSP